MNMLSPLTVSTTRIIRRWTGLTGVVMAAGLFLALVPSSGASAATVTKSCGTGGYSYTTDKMFVSRTYLGSSQWRYKVTRSENRTVTANVSGTRHYVTHTAVALNQYVAGTVKKVANPGSTTNMYSRQGNDDFGMWFKVSDGANLNLQKGCYVRF